MLVLLYYYVCSAKYIRVIFEDFVDKIIAQTCEEIFKRYEINTDGDYIHFLIQSIPTLTLTVIVRIIKSITAREIYRLYPQIKKKLWGGNIWSTGYFVSIVGKSGNEEQIKNMLEIRGKNILRYIEVNSSYSSKAYKIPRGLPRGGSLK